MTARPAEPGRVARRPWPGPARAAGPAWLGPAFRSGLARLGSARPRPIHHSSSIIIIHYHRHPSPPTIHTPSPSPSSSMSSNQRGCPIRALLCEQAPRPVAHVWPGRPTDATQTARLLVCLSVCLHARPPHSRLPRSSPAQSPPVYS